MKKLLALILFALPALAQSAPPSTSGGFYVVCNTSSGGTDLANCNTGLTQSYTSGVRLVFLWSAIETGNGVYNWSTTPLGSSGRTFNQWVQLAMADGLNIEISLAGGTWYPSSWLSPATMTCHTLTAPLPWDATYYNAYNAAITAIAAQLNTLGAANYIKDVTIGGIDDTTAELNVEVSSATDTNSCPGNSINAAWAAAGLTPALITSTFNTLVANYVAAFPVGTFPNVAFSVDVIVPAFPPVNNDGSRYIAPPGGVDGLTYQMLASLFANATYSATKFSVQWDAISNIPPTIQPMLSLYQGTNGFHNVTVAWQLNERGGVAGGTYCNYSGTYRACDGTITGTVAGDFELIVNNCVALSGKRCEFWGANAATLATAITNIKAKSMGLPQ